MAKQKDYSMIKSKYLIRKFLEADRKNEIEMQEWWNKILPRKGSLLRQLVDIELNN